jgi:hypothetical protein
MDVEEDVERERERVRGKADFWIKSRSFIRIFSQSGEHHDIQRDISYTALPQRPSVTGIIHLVEPLPAPLANSNQPLPTS